jgi:hypothetical protein
MRARGQGSRCRGVLVAVCLHVLSGVVCLDEWDGVRSCGVAWGGAGWGVVGVE